MCALVHQGPEAAHAVYIVWTHGDTTSTFEYVCINIIGHHLSSIKSTPLSKIVPDPYRAGEYSLINCVSITRDVKRNDLIGYVPYSHSA